MVSLHVGSPTNQERVEIFKFALFRSRKTSRIQIFVKGVNGFGASKWRVYCESVSTDSGGMASECRKIAEARRKSISTGDLLKSKNQFSQKLWSKRPSGYLTEKNYCVSDSLRHTTAISAGLSLYIRQCSFLFDDYTNSAPRSFGWTQNLGTNDLRVHSL